MRALRYGLYARPSSGANQAAQRVLGLGAQLLGLALEAAPRAAHVALDLAAPACDRTLPPTDGACAAPLEAVELARNAVSVRVRPDSPPDRLANRRTRADLNQQRALRAAPDRGNPARRLIDAPCRRSPRVPCGGARLARGSPGGAGGPTGRGPRRRAAALGSSPLTCRRGLGG